MAGQNKWLRLFQDFVADIRIVSKEVVSDDPRGTPLVLWESQRRFIKNVGEGLDDGIHIFNCLKSRQLGVTTISLALLDVFWLAMHDNMIGALVTDTDENKAANRILIRKYVNGFPEGYFGGKFEIVDDNRNLLTFSNGSTLRLLVAGTKKKSLAWAEGTGYTLLHITECAKYANPDGLKSLFEGFAQVNPHRLAVMESTANGYNHWKSRYDQGVSDPYTQRSFFIGWWSGDTNRIEKSDPRFRIWGKLSPDKDEREKIAAVAKLYQWQISPEQLAWIRWKESDAGRDQDLLQQNQPWTAQDAFVQSGRSFFAVRVINKDLKKREESIKAGESTYRFDGYKYVETNTFLDFYMVEELEDLDLVELKIWEEPKPNGKYAIGFDVAYGRNEHKDGNCCAQDTELLTKQGWRKYTDIKVGDEAVCFDCDSEQYTYGAISKIHIFDYEGDMCHFTSKGLDALVTLDHRVISRNYRVRRDGNKQSWRAYKAAEIANAGRSVREIPVGGSPIGEGFSGLSLKELRFLGWIFTDGSVRLSNRETGRPCITLIQAKNTIKNGVCVADAMAQIVGELCPRAKITTQLNNLCIYIGVEETERYSRWLTTGLKGTRRVPRVIIEDSSREQLETFFQGILEGDGSWEAPWGWRKVSSGLGEGLADDIQEIALKLGYSPSRALIPSGENFQWQIRLARRETHTFEAPNVSQEHYSGKVWCVTVPTGAFVIRRNGKVSVTGNCIEVFRCFADCMVQVAEYATYGVDVRYASWVFFHLCAAYGDVMGNIEIGGPGRLVMQEFAHLRELLGAEHNQERVKARNWQDATANARWYLYHKPDSLGAGYVYNFETNWSTKRPLMHTYASSYITDCIEIRSRQLLDEMTIVQDNDGDIGAPDSTDINEKDDRVFAAALAHKAWVDWIRSDMLAQGQTFERVMKDERGEVTPQARVVDGIVYRFLARQTELADQEPPRGTPFQIRNGLV